MMSQQVHRLPPLTVCATAPGAGSALIMGTALLMGAALMALAPKAHAADAGITRVDVPGFPISASVSVPAGAATVYLSGTTPPVADPSAPKDSLAAYGDTQTQTVNTLKRIEEILAKQNLGLGDVVMMHVYLVGDPAKGGKMDFAGMMAGYTQFFGTAQQPNKPARTTVQVSALANPGLLVEIEVLVAKHP